MTAQRRLLLIKHSLPETVNGVEARDWKVSEEGRRRCQSLAYHIVPYAPGIIVASQEPKARETAQLVGSALGIAVESAPGLHEHDRTGVWWLGREEFEASVRSLFARPHELVFGRETAREAEARFSQAVEDAIARHPTGSIAIVAHGTVISLYVASRTGIDAFALWQRLGLPSFVVLSLEEGRLFDIVESV